MSKLLTFMLSSILAFSQPISPKQHKNQDAFHEFVFNTHLHPDSCIGGWYQVFENNGKFIYTFTCGSRTGRMGEKDEPILFGFIESLRKPIAAAPIDPHLVKQISEGKIMFKNMVFTRIIAGGIAMGG